MAAVPEELFWALGWLLGGICAAQADVACEDEWVVGWVGWVWTRDAYGYWAGGVVASGGAGSTS